MDVFRHVTVVPPSSAILRLWGGKVYQSCSRWKWLKMTFNTELVLLAGERFCKFNSPYTSLNHSSAAMVMKTRTEDETSLEADLEAGYGKCSKDWIAHGQMGDKGDQRLKQPSTNEKLQRAAVDPATYFNGSGYKRERQKEEEKAEERQQPQEQQQQQQLQSPKSFQVLFSPFVFQKK